MLDPALSGPPEKTVLKGSLSLFLLISRFLQSLFRRTGSSTGKGDCIDLCLGVLPVVRVLIFREKGQTSWNVKTSTWVGSGLITGTSSFSCDSPLRKSQKGRSQEASACLRERDFVFTEEKGNFSVSGKAWQELRWAGGICSIGWTRLSSEPRGGIFPFFIRWNNL